MHKTVSYRYLSHIVDEKTPTYGNGADVKIYKTEAIREGAVANESALCMPVHSGTHIDLPCHFYEEGADISAYDAAQWIFNKVLLVELFAKETVIKEELIAVLKEQKDCKDTDLLLVKTGIENFRSQKKFWYDNPGFHADLYDFLREKFPKLRAFGFDSISLTHYQSPVLGRQAHRAFLNPEHPLLIIEDMHLQECCAEDSFEQVIVAPLRLRGSDGLPCSVIASLSTLQE